MSRLKPDPTFYPSPKMAMEAPQEKYGYVAGLNYGNGKPDAILVVDPDKNSRKYGQVISQADLPYVGDELHHFGWNACSSALCPYAPHPHLERRYLIIPGLRSSRIYIFDTQPYPLKPKLIKTIEPEEIMAKTGYSFDVIGPWKLERGDQELAYDFWWQIAQDTLITSEWGRPNQFKNGGIAPTTRRAAALLVVGSIALLGGFGAF